MNEEVKEENAELQSPTKQKKKKETTNGTSSDDLLKSPTPKHSKSKRRASSVKEKSQKALDEDLLKSPVSKHSKSKRRASSVKDKHHKSPEKSDKGKVEKEKKDKKRKKKKDKKSHKSSSKRNLVVDGGDSSSSDSEEVEDAPELKEEDTETETAREEEDDVIPVPNNPPMELIILKIQQPNESVLEMKDVDPANTTIDMVRKFLCEHYYKGKDVPRQEQRKLLWKKNNVFEPLTLSPKQQDSKTLAEYQITKQGSIIELSKMTIQVISPTTKKGIVINNVDPMNDKILDMKKLALDDGYPIERLRVLHKEATDPGKNEILDTQNQQTFFDCGIKEGHTLILEWPWIDLNIRIPYVEGPKMFTYKCQAEIAKVESIHDFIFKETKIPVKQQKLIAKIHWQQKDRETTLPDKSKLIADYKLRDQDGITLLPMTLTIKYYVPGKKDAVNLKSKFFPTDTVLHVKDYIGKGITLEQDDSIGQEAITTPTMPAHCLEIRCKGDELENGKQMLFEAEVQDGDELHAAKTKITIGIQLPNGKVLEIGVNPKVDTSETMKNLVSEATGVPKEFLPKFSYLIIKEDNPKKPLSEYNLKENDVILFKSMEVTVQTSLKFTDYKHGSMLRIMDVDPFHATVKDIKEKVAKMISSFSVDMQRLVFNDTILDDCDDKKLYECGIANFARLQLERQSISIQIVPPNDDAENEITLHNIDPRTATLANITTFLSYTYYKGKDKDGTIPESQLRPLVYNDVAFEATDNKTLMELGLIDDNQVLQMTPMHVNVILPGDGCDAEPVSSQVDPMNDTVQDLKLLSMDKGIPMDKLMMLRMDDTSSEEPLQEDKSFYDQHIKEGDTILIQRKPISVQIRLPEHSKIVSIDVNLVKDKPNVLQLNIDPDKVNWQFIPGLVEKAVGLPTRFQKLYKIVDDEDKVPLSGVKGSTRLSDEALNIVDDCVIEMAPMAIKVQTAEDGDSATTLAVLHSDTIEELKKRLAAGNVTKIPYDRQRLLRQDWVTELGGDEDNIDSKGSDKSTLLELGVEDGETLSVEKGKIALKVRMPNGTVDIPLLVDFKTATVDKIRRLIFEATGLPEKYQQRILFNDVPLDNGYETGAGGDAASNHNVTKLSAVDGLRENAVLTLDATKINVMKGKTLYEVDGLDPINDTLQDLRKKIALKTSMAPHRQRLLHKETDEEYVGGKDSTKKLIEYDIQDGDVLTLEFPKISVTIILPSKEELQMDVDPRHDDLQKVRDFLFEKYYRKRVIPAEDLRPMMIRAKKADKEPGETKLLKFGLSDDGDTIKLIPCTLIFDGPTKNSNVHANMQVPNIDPFVDNLGMIRDLAKSQGIPVDDLVMKVNGKEMTDFETVLYDLSIGDVSSINFVEK